MNNVKLLIESHKKTNNNTISYFVDKIKYVKDSTYLHKILKEKLKDRHRVKGAFFSAPKINKKKEKNEMKKNKENSFDLLDIDEANYLLTMKNYEKLKHELHLKEKRDKALRLKETRNFELFKKEINYTTLKETIYQFLRFRKNSYLYKANILKSKNELKQASKIGKKNMINQTLKNVILHFNKVKGKVDLGKKPIEETENEYAYKKLVEQIAKSRLKYMKIKSENLQNSPNKKQGFRKSIMILNRTENNNGGKNFFELLSSCSNNENVKSENLNGTIKFENKVSEFNLNDNKMDEDNKKEKEKENKQIICKTENNETENNNKTYFRDRTKKNISKKKKKVKKHRFIQSDKAIKIDINNFKKYFENDSIAQRLNNIKYDTQTHSQSNNNLNIYSKSTFFNNTRDNIITNNIKIFNDNLLNNNEISSKILPLENNKKNDKTKRNENNSSSTLGNKSSNSYSNNKQNLKELRSLEKIRKNNLEIIKRKNPLYWSDKYKRLNTAGHRTISNKVINKPLYTTKIGDLVKEYNRIKSATKNSSIRLKEKHMITNDEIEKIVKIKEDLLMFNLKMKFLNCNFPQKKQKHISKRLIFKKKLTNCMEIIEDPFNVDFDLLTNEEENDNF